MERVCGEGKRAQRKYFTVHSVRHGKPGPPRAARSSILRVMKNDSNSVIVFAVSQSGAGHDNGNLSKQMASAP